MRVRFLAHAVAKAGNVKGECDKGAASEYFSAGQIVEMSEPSARHWINRRKAEIYEEPKPAQRQTMPSGKKED